MLLFYSGHYDDRRYQWWQRINRAMGARLLSCFKDYFPGPHREFLRTIGPEWRDKEFMADSGAFTAWSKGSKVTLRELIPIYDRMLELMSPHVGTIWMIGLDVIPGKRKGPKATKGEVEAAIAESDRNFEQLHRRYGDRMVPVFHMGETEERLAEVVRQNPKYIALSPLVGTPTKIKMAWLNRILHRLPPTVRTHGLAVTATELMRRLPMSTADSTSWILRSAYGFILVWNDGSVMEVGVSTRSPTQTLMDRHITTLDADNRARILAEVEERGYNIDVLASLPEARMCYNVETYEMLVRDITVHVPVLEPQQHTLFDL